jgi:hypothetical protein
MGQAAEHLLCKYKALSSNSSLTKKKKKNPSMFLEHAITPTKVMKEDASFKRSSGGTAFSSTKLHIT